MALGSISSFQIFSKKQIVYLKLYKVATSTNVKDCLLKCFHDIMMVILHDLSLSLGVSRLAAIQDSSWSEDPPHVPALDQAPVSCRKSQKQLPTPRLTGGPLLHPAVA